MRPNRMVRSTAGIGMCSCLTLSILFVSYGCSTLRNAGCDEIISIGSEGYEDSQAHVVKGVKLFDKGKFQAASEEFQRAISFQQENGAAHNNLGLVYLQQRKLSDAAKEFEIAAQFLQEDPTPWNNLGLTLESAGRGQESVEYFQHAYELAPEKPLYLGNLVRSRIRLGENDEAVVAQLRELLFIETRPDWVAWINDQLALDMNPMLDRGPDRPKFSPKNKATGVIRNELRSELSLQRNEDQLAPVVKGNGERLLPPPTVQRSEMEFEQVLPKNPHQK
jgi:tetratricopeptide (TPR) repeat protein